MNERRIIYILLCCGCFTISFNVAAIAAVIPAMSLDLVLPDFMVSKIITWYMIPYGIGALIYAPLTKRFSYKWIFVTSLGLYAIASFFCAQAQTLTQLIIGRAAMGLSGASAIPLGLIIIGQLFDKNVRGRLVGAFFSCSFIASIIGIFVGGITHWSWLFSIPGIMGAITAASILFLRGDLIKHIHGVDVNYIRVFKDARIQNVFLFIFAISFLYHGVHKWFGVYLDRVYGLDQFVISLFFILISLGGAFGQLGGGWISDKKGRFVACAMGLVLLSVATCALALYYPLWALGFVLFVMSVGWTIGHNGVSTVLTDFSEDFRPAIASLNSSVRFVSGGLGFYISSFFVKESFSLTFLGIGILMFMTSFFLKKIALE